MTLPDQASEDRPTPSDPPSELASPHHPGATEQAQLAAAMQFLGFALEVAANFDPSQPDHGRSSVRAALVGVIRLIAELFPNKPALPISLNHLLYALWDLDHGKVVPLLEPSKVAHNPGVALVEDLFKALPSAAATRLMDERAMSRKLAGQAIARRLTKIGYKLPSGEITGNQVLKWRERMTTEMPSENRAAAQYQLALQLVRPMKRQQAVDFLMDCMPQLYPPKNPKKLPS